MKIERIIETKNGVQLEFPNDWVASIAWTRPMHYAGPGTVELALMRNDHVVPGLVHNPEGWVPVENLPLYLERIADLRTDANANELQEAIAP